MFLLIDGYNCIRTWYASHGNLHGVKSDEDRKRFIRLIGAYVGKKQKRLRGIYIVLDGGISRHAQVTREHGVLVQHAGAGRSADDWIVSFCEQNRGEVLVITSDRELTRRVTSNAGLSANVFLFRTIVSELTRENHEHYSRSLSGDITIYHDTNQADHVIYDIELSDDDQLERDMLMEQGSQVLQRKKHEEHQKTERRSISRGNARSKKERQQAKIEALLR